ncbi:hypothetical protein TVAG_081750 [Trichomonas vaginalis G3]|uniref:Serine/threonine-protein phosphatase 2A 55 kDa regulatory subunit B n=1 Tax=Trichomonas vaginalis (strain ATCC PRA-98 / G3) TaxID=412133 RepID=A2E6W7_TRIV3|nr:peptidyl-serine dephosphorylation [Trichomonas vaginalis G3]EAY11603.1 hypothetical protein TVAG_081750 [Trichomonas vaginalis G3]KAI5516514.1 peptidyl-serine dephosphorylation [Trichomonas vaginalis G3]|eukprot:XP_001323826.1 hypothetical protein [Trichomonas vaginalis G3]
MNLDYLASFGDHVALSQFKTEDTISVLSFSKNGRFLASGDAAGRVVIFQLNPPKSAGGKSTVSFVVQVHAHKASFDYFRSELSDPKINSLKWVKTETVNPLLLTCNSHDAKLWKFTQNSKITWNPLNTDVPIDQFVLPKPRQVEAKYTAECVKSFTDLQTEYLVDLHSLSDQRSFVLVDVGCVKLWDMERDVPSVSLYRLPSTNSELMCSDVHDSLPSAVLIGDDCGVAKIIDMRQQAEDLTPSIVFNIRSKLSPDKQCADCESIGSLAFSPDGINFVARTFGECQIWDVRNPSTPVAKIETQWFPDQMDWLASEDIVKDQFRTCFTLSGKVVTGLYGADFISWDPKSNEVKHHRAISSRTPRDPPDLGRDFTKRVTVCEAHPKQDIIACVSTAALYMFSARQQTRI